jgi:hypothetical protein
MSETNAHSPKKLAALYADNCITCNEAASEAILAMRDHDIEEVMSVMPFEVRLEIRGVVEKYAPTMASNHGPEYVPSAEIVEQLKRWFQLH